MNYFERGLFISSLDSCNGFVQKREHLYIFFFNKKDLFLIFLFSLKNVDQWIREPVDKTQRNSDEQNLLLLRFNNLKLNFVLLFVYIVCPISPILYSKLLYKCVKTYRISQVNFQNNDYASKIILMVLYDQEVLTCK